MRYFTKKRFKTRKRDCHRKSMSYFFSRGPVVWKLLKSCDKGHTLSIISDSLICFLVPHTGLPAFFLLYGQRNQGSRSTTLTVLFHYYKLHMCTEHTSANVATHFCTCRLRLCLYWPCKQMSPTNYATSSPSRKKYYCKQDGLKPRKRHPPEMASQNRGNTLGWGRSKGAAICGCSIVVKKWFLKNSKFPTQHSVILHKYSLLVT